MINSSTTSCCHCFVNCCFQGQDFQLYHHQRWSVSHFNIWLCHFHEYIDCSCEWVAHSFMCFSVKMNSYTCRGVKQEVWQVTWGLDLYWWWRCVPVYRFKLVCGCTITYCYSRSCVRVCAWYLFCCWSGVDVLKETLSSSARHSNKKKIKIQHDSTNHRGQLSAEEEVLTAHRCRRPEWELLFSGDPPLGGDRHQC